VHHHQAGGGAELHREIAVAHRIKAVGVDVVEAEGRSGVAAVDRHRRARQGRSTERADVDPLQQIGQAGPVALGHLHVGQQVMGQADRLGPLQVGVTRDHHLGMGLGLGQQGPLEAHQGRIDLGDAATQPQAQVGADLIVAGAAGVQLLAERTEDRDQTPLDGEVHVLVLKTGAEAAGGRLGAHPLEPTHQLLRLFRADHAGAGEHAGVGDRTVEVLLQQRDVEADRGVEALDGGMEPLLEPLTPGGGGGIHGHRARSRCWPQLGR